MIPYFSGDHGVPQDRILNALAAVLNIPICELREAADLPSGAEEPYVPPQEANFLDCRQRRALDELIRSIVKTQGVETTTEPDAPRETGEGEKSKVRRLVPRDPAPSIDVRVSAPRIPEWWDLHRLANEALEHGVMKDMVRAWPNVVSQEVQKQARVLGWRDAGQECDVNALSLEQFRELSWAVAISIRDRLARVPFPPNSLPPGVEDHLSSLPRDSEDEVAEEEFSTAARRGSGPSRGEVECEQHTSAGEESQVDPDDGR